MSLFRALFGLPDTNRQPLKFCNCIERNHNFYRFRTNRGTCTIAGNFIDYDIYRQDPYTFYVTLYKANGHGCIHEINFRGNSNPVEYF